MQALREYKNRHAGERALVIGCGRSAEQIRGLNLSGVVTFGVNDACRLTTLDYHVVVDVPSRFSGKRFDMVYRTTAKKLLTQHVRWKIKDASKFILFKQGDRRPNHIDRDRWPETIDYSNNSPYMATIIAYKMGITEMGLIGVDFTPGHFYNKEDGDHELVVKRRAKVINRDWDQLVSILNKSGVGIYNLSEDSILSGIPKMGLTEYVNQ